MLFCIDGFSCWERMRKNNRLYFTFYRAHEFVLWYHKNGWHMIVETEAVILRTIKYGDTSKIVTLYSKKFGKLKAIAKGARSQKSKFGSSLEPMTISSVVLYKKEHKELHLLSKSEIAQTLSSLQDNSDRMFTGLALVELVNMVMHDEEENAAAYALLRKSLEMINNADKNYANVFIAFMLKLFELFGFGIGVNNCVVCNKSAMELNGQFAYLRLSDGKFVCSNCSSRHGSSGVKIDKGMLKSFHYLQNNDLGKATALSLPLRNEMMAIMQSYLRYHIEGTRTLKSLSLLYSTT